MKRQAHVVRMPRSATARLRAAIRRDGLRAAALAWGLTPTHALRVAADVGVPRRTIAAVLRRLLAEVENG